jgi:hypothetical protein
MQSAPSRIFTLCLLGLLVVSTIATAGIYWRVYGFEKLFGDFSTFRAAAMHAAAHELPDVYDVGTAQRLLATTGIKEFSYFLNPPTGLFIVYPLAFLGALPGLVFWVAAQLALLLMVLHMDYMRALFAPQGREGVHTYPLLVITFAAFCLQNLLFAQVATLCSALFLLVLAWRRSRPALAGVMLGIFSFKPQLGLLLPLLLLAEKNWKVLIWAAATAAAMILLTVGLWGTGLWRDYSAMLSIRGQFLATDPTLLFSISTSAYAALRNLGASAGLALACQGGIVALLLILLWPVLRRGKESHKILMLTLCAYLVTPYALIYDIPLLAVPCALLLRRAEADVAPRSELLALLLLILVPVVTLMLQISHIPYSVIAIGSALIVANRLIMRERNG